MHAHGGFSSTLAPVSRSTPLSESRALAASACCLIASRARIDAFQVCRVYIAESASPLALSSSSALTRSEIFSFLPTVPIPARRWGGPFPLSKPYGFPTCARPSCKPVFASDQTRKWCANVGYFSNDHHMESGPQPIATMRQAEYLWICFPSSRSGKLS